MSIKLVNSEGKVEVEHVGEVLKVWVNTGYQIMSDVWGSALQAMVWDQNNGRPKTVTVWVDDMGQRYGKGSEAEVDATPAVLEQYLNYLINQEFHRIKSQEVARVEKIVKGCQVEVVAGRKVKKGTKGKVVAMIERAYGFGYSARLTTKLGIATSDEMHEVVGKNGKVYLNHKDVEWVWIHNCQRIDVEQINEIEIMERATAAGTRVFEESRR